MSSYVELAVLDETDTVAVYMQAKFQAVMQDLGSIFQKPDSFIPFPGEWSLEYACEVDQAISIIVQAFRNQGKYNRLLSI